MSHLHSEYERGMLVQAARALADLELEGVDCTSRTYKCAEREFRRHWGNATQSPEQPEDLGQLVNCAKLVVFSSEGYVPQVKS